MATNKPLPFTLPNEGDSPRPAPTFPVSYQRTRLPLPSSRPPPRATRSSTPLAPWASSAPFHHAISPLQISPTPTLPPTSPEVPTPALNPDSQAPPDDQDPDIDTPTESEVASDYEPSEISSQGTIAQDFDFFVARVRRKLTQVLLRSHQAHTHWAIGEYLRHFLATSLEKLAMAVDPWDLRRIVDNTLGNILLAALGRTPQFRPGPLWSRYYLDQMYHAVWRFAQDRAAREKQRVDERLRLRMEIERKTTTERETTGEGSTDGSVEEAENAADSDPGDSETGAESDSRHGGSGEGSDEDVDETESEGSGYESETETEIKREPKSESESESDFLRAHSPERLRRWFGPGYLHGRHSGTGDN